MAISLEELAAGALDGSVGPLTLAVGASALAVVLAAGSARPLRRMAATSALAAGRAGRAGQVRQVRQVSLTGWLGATRRRWRGMVDEARAEYEAGRRRGPAGGETAVPPLVVASASGAVSEPGQVVVPSPGDAPGEAPGRAGRSAGSRTRDQRGRFVRQATNGTQPQ
jgi:hypothetical protein